MIGHLLDLGRGLYSGLPAGTRKRLGPVLGMVPARLRYGKTYRDWRSRIARAAHDTAFVKAWRADALSHVLALAATRSPYYRESFESVFGPDVDPASLAAPHLFARIPVIGTAHVRENKDRMCTVPLDKLDAASTGGSSGQPLTFYLDRNRSPVEYAFIMDQWAQAGCSEEDWRATFRGFHIDDVEREPVEADPGLRELRISVYHMRDDLMARYREELIRRQIRFLQGYPSALVTFAAYLLRHHGPMEQVTGILPHSERIYPEYRDTIERAFPNARLVPFFGLSEKCAFAIEIEPDVYAFNPLYGYTELVDDDGRVVTTPGQVGRLVSTGLLFTGMPFIRYATGDEATLEQLPTAANNYRLVVRRIVPRWGHEYLVSRSHHLIHVGALTMMDQELAHVTDYQYIQDSPGIVRMRTVLAEGRSAREVAAYADMVSERSAGELQLKVELVDALPLTERGKRRLIIQKLDINGFVADAGVPVVADEPEWAHSL